MELLSRCNGRIPLGRRLEEHEAVRCTGKLALIYSDFLIVISIYYIRRCILAQNTQSLSFIEIRVVALRCAILHRLIEHLQPYISPISSESACLAIHNSVCVSQSVRRYCYAFLITAIKLQLLTSSSRPEPQVGRWKIMSTVHTKCLTQLACPARPTSIHLLSTDALDQACRYLSFLPGSSLFVLPSHLFIKIPASSFREANATDRSLRWKFAVRL